VRRMLHRKPWLSVFSKRYFSFTANIYGRMCWQWLWTEATRNLWDIVTYWCPHVRYTLGWQLSIYGCNPPIQIHFYLNWVSHFYLIVDRADPISNRCGYHYRRCILKQ
jgi:hypothetical protein